MDALPPGSQIFFPLQSSIELFRDPRMLDPVTRVKQAALLYDTVIIELGYFETLITDAFQEVRWHPPGSLNADEVVALRAPPPEGQLVPLWISEGHFRFTDVGPRHILSEHPLKQRHVAEFHTGVIDCLGPPWPHWLRFTLVGARNPKGDLGARISALNSQDQHAKDVLPELTGFEREFVHSAFNRDAVLAADLQAALSITSIFESMATHRGVVPIQGAGDIALQFIVPDLSVVEWEQILEFREHPGAEEARGRLREFEQTATRQGPADARDFLLRVGQEITNSYQATITELRPHFSDEIARQLISNTISFIPLVGPALSSGLSLADAAVEQVKFSQSATAALMTLSG